MAVAKTHRPSQASSRHGGRSVGARGLAATLDWALCRCRRGSRRSLSVRFSRLTGGPIHLIAIVRHPLLALQIFQIPNGGRLSSLARFVHRGLDELDEWVFAGDSELRRVSRADGYDYRCSRRAGLLKADLGVGLLKGPRCGGLFLSAHLIQPAIGKRPTLR